MRVADYVVGKLNKIGIKDVFLITGRGILYLSDAVAKNPDVRGVSMHHEQACAYAAYAYAKKTASFGACLVSTGCAATNAVTGCLCAWQDGVPCIFISGQNILKDTTYYTNLNIRTFGEQEADIVEIVKPITKYAVMIKNPEDIICEMDKAIKIANSGRKGPVWIDIPLDIQNGRIDVPEKDDVETYFTECGYKCTDDDVETVVNMLESSERPIVLMGSGIASSGAEKVVCEFCQNHMIPVVFDSAAVDIFADENELSIGTIGAMGGSRAGNFAVQNSDMVISIGCRLTSMQVGDIPDHFARAARKVVIDIDDEEIKKQTIHTDLFIHSDALYFLNCLKNRIADIEFSDWASQCIRWKRVFPKCEQYRKENEKVDLYYLADVIGVLAEKGDAIISDAGIEELVIPSVVCKKQGVRCIHPVSQGAMGFALPAAIGANIADDSRTISIIGDGSIMMNLQELQTISFLNLNVKIFVVNNNCYSVIRRRQKDLFRNRTIGTDYENGVACPDFRKVANAFDIDYYLINDSFNLEADIQNVLKHNGPVLCEVMGIEDQTYLHNSYTINEERKMVRRSLEDQSPFLDRNLIKKELIVDYLG